MKPRHLTTSESFHCENTLCAVLIAVMLSVVFRGTTFLLIVRSDCSEVSGSEVW